MLFYGIKYFKHKIATFHQNSSPTATTCTKRKQRNLKANRTRRKANDSVKLAEHLASQKGQGFEPQDR